jgi:hypothetical protein
MTIGTERAYQSITPEDKREFDRWLNSNAILSSIFAIGLLAMAVAAIVVPYHQSEDVAAVAPTSIRVK